MKTIIILDRCGTEPITFFVVKGDFRHLHMTYINSTIIVWANSRYASSLADLDGEEFDREYEKAKKDHEDRCSELYNLLYDRYGNLRPEVKQFDTFPVLEVPGELGALNVVITAGFVP